MGEYKHGSMDITEQQKTFDGFVTFATRSVIAIIVFLLFLALIGG